MFRGSQMQCFEIYWSISQEYILLRAGVQSWGLSSTWWCPNHSRIQKHQCPVRGLTPQCSLPNPSCCRRSFLWLWVNWRQQQAACLALCCYGSDAQPGPLAPGFPAETPPACYGEQFCSKAPPLITHCSHFCCMLLINFSIVRKQWMAQRNSKRKPETLLSFLCEVFWAMSHHPNKVYKSRTPWWPKIYSNVTTDPGTILPHFHLHPQIQSLFFFPAAHSALLKTLLGKSPAVWQHCLAAQGRPETLVF